MAIEKVCSEVTQKYLYILYVSLTTDICTILSEWKTHLGTLFALFFGRALDERGKKCQYLAQNDQKCIFWTKFGRFWAKNPNFYGSK